jgi:hypothetical protein
MTRFVRPIDRLAGTRITTDIRTGDDEQRDSLGLIDAASIRRKHGDLMGACSGSKSSSPIGPSTLFVARRCSPSTVTISGSASLSNVVSMNSRGNTAGGKRLGGISTETLLKKSGPQSWMKRFRQHVKEIAQHDHLPHYRLIFDETADVIVFFNRDGKWVERP